MFSVATLTDEQEMAMSAIDAFMADPRRQVFNLHGLAGTGKTTVLRHVAAQYRHAVLCSLTGKAASVLRRRSGLQACTLHSFFYRLIEANKDKRGRDVLRFERQHEGGELHGDLVLLDESSMIGDEIGRDLLATGAKVIACGDPGQLPPVKGQQFFRRADATLVEIHRQALESSIVRQAHAVRGGGSYAADGPCFRVASDGTDDDLRGVDVVLCWTNRTRDYMNAKCRRVRGYWQPMPQTGEPVVCLKNAPQYGIFNGATYTLQRPFLQADTSIVIDVDGNVMEIPRVTFRAIPSTLADDVEATTAFDFGYAMTVHRAQGSEWDSVVLVDEYRRYEQRKEWLYTGITRAAERILIVR
jgi:ATP-dependent exoDNAse (exonuclease V) alpha subunit